MKRRAALAATLAAAVLAAGCGRPARPPRTTTTPTAPAGHEHADDHSGTHADGPWPARPAAPTMEAERAAVAFVTAWARPTLPAEQWHAGVAAWCAADYAAVLRGVDPARVPARAVTGAPTVVSAVDGLVVWDVPTDAGPVTVNTAQSADHLWQVTRVLPARAGS